MRSLRRAGYDVVAMNPREMEIDRMPCYPTVAEAVAATGPVDVVDVFRRADLCVEHAREAVAGGATAADVLNTRSVEELRWPRRARPPRRARCRRSPSTGPNFIRLLR